MFGVLTFDNVAVLRSGDDMTLPAISGMTGGLTSLFTRSAVKLLLLTLRNEHLLAGGGGGGGGGSGRGGGCPGPPLPLITETLPLLFFLLQG